MGLVVEGSVEVDHAGEHLAELGPSSVFGEFAFLHDTARNASLTATTSVLLWSWEPSWLDEEVERTSLRSQLEALAAQRSAQSID